MTATANEVSYDPVISAVRQALYRFAAVSLLDPKWGSWDQLQLLRDDPLLTKAAALLRDEPAARLHVLAPGEGPLVDLDPVAVLDALPASATDLNELFERTFGLLVSNACPPYETEYINSKFSFQRSNALADIGGFYRAFGLTTSHECPERPDHIVQELEFMAFLIGLTRQAEEMKSPLGDERRIICCEAQVRFLSEHLTWWAPTFARLLAHEAPGGFYEQSGKFLAALIPIERALFAISPPSLPPAPSILEKPEACDGCPISN